MGEGDDLQGWIMMEIIGVYYFWTPIRKYQKIFNRIMGLLFLRNWLLFEGIFMLLTDNEAISL